MLNHPDQMFFGHVAFYAILFCYICGMVIYHNLITLAKNDITVDVDENNAF